jgi:hypothetical protein
MNVFEGGTWVDQHSEMVRSSRCKKKRNMTCSAVPSCRVIGTKADRARHVRHGQSQMGELDAKGKRVVHVCSPDNA